MFASRRSLLTLIMTVLVLSAAVQWWHGWHEAKLGEALAQRAAPGDIRILSSDHCDDCEFVRHWFTQYGVRYTECPVDHDPQCAAQLRDLKVDMPPVVVVRGKAHLRFDPQAMLDALG
jgi:glutaredoxin